LHVSGRHPVADTARHPRLIPAIIRARLGGDWGITGIMGISWGSGEQAPILMMAEPSFDYKITDDLWIISYNFRADGANDVPNAP